MQVDGIGFPLSSDECELLLALESARTLVGMSGVLRKDVSVLSRQLQRLSTRAPVASKENGKWALTEVGRQITRWARDASSSQRQVLRQLIPLRIASTREFGARVLSPQLRNVFPEASQLSLTVLTSETGVEEALLSGEADIGFDCGNPTDPLVAFKSVATENFVITASPGFIDKYHATHANLLSLPHLQYRRAMTPRLLKLSYDLPRVVAAFNDIAAIREACCAGLGWAVLPAYSVKREVEASHLQLISGWKIDSERFGVWWIRGRRWLDPWVKDSVAWLKRQRLDLGS